MGFSPYMKDSYCNEWKTHVASVTDGKFVRLATSFFYPASGGQPHDTGTLTTPDGRRVTVVFVGTFDGAVSHQVSPEGVLQEGDTVLARIDWERRYALMRMHTAAHIISMVFEQRKGAHVTGNQLGTDRSRIDYELDDYDPEEMKRFEQDVNEILSRELPVQSHYVSREEAERMCARLNTLKVGFPEHITDVRLLQIGDVDMQACGGTHLANTREIGRVEFLKFDNKGKANRRVYYTIRP